MNRTNFQTKWWQRMLLTLLVCMFAGGGRLFAASDYTHSFEEDGMSKIRHQPTLKEPWIEIEMTIYDNYGDDGFFLHSKAEPGNDGPAVYVNGEYVCSPNYELAWPGGYRDHGNWSKLKDEIPNNEWWGNVYEGSGYTVRFWNPFLKEHGKDNSYVRVTMFIFPDLWEVGKQYTVKVKGEWRICTSFSKEEDNWVEKEWTTNPFPTIWKVPDTDMTSKEEVNVSGKLDTLVSSTRIGFYTQDTKAPNVYISENEEGMFGKTHPAGINSESYQNVKVPFVREKFNVFKDLPIQYSGKITADPKPDVRPRVKKTMKVFQWLTASVPGFAYPENVTCEKKNQWDKTITVSWNRADTVTYDKKKRWLSTAGTWTIYNATTQTVLESGIKYDKLSRDVKLESYDTPNTIEVYFVPSKLDSLPAELMSSAEASIHPVWNFTDLTARETDDGIVLNWTHNALEDAKNNNKYYINILRTTNPDSNSWTTIGTKEVNDTTTSGTYTDTSSNLEPNTTYYYQLMVTVFGTNQYSPRASARLGGSKLEGFTASQGTYSNTVKLQWTVKQVGSFDTNFTVYRRPLGSLNESDWTSIYTTSGKTATYTYDDVTAQPGNYNEYKVAITSNDDGKQTEDDILKADGFCLATGLISGNISYGTGTAVEGAKVTLKQQNPDGEIISGMRSVLLTNYGSGFKYACDQSNLNELFSGDFSIQMYAHPLLREMSTDSAYYKIMDVWSTFGLYLHYNQEDSTYRLGVSLGKNNYDSDLIIEPDAWTQINCVHKSDAAKTVLYVMDGDQVKSCELDIKKEEGKVNVSDLEEDQRCVAIGNNCYFDSQDYYQGYLDEFRFWTKALAPDDIRKNYNHPLAGSESNLAIYYPFDEGLEKQTKAYDLSKKNGIANGRHAKTKVAAEGTTKVPHEEQLSQMAVTDVNGYYEIRGIPFSGDGTSYTVIPTLGIHEFSPSTRSRFVSMSSLTHSGVDFKDVSSFPVSGKVFYAGTDYPVEGAYLYVDGIVSSKDGKIIQTNEDGEYSISVPIGDHFVSVEMNGHVFVNGGRYPIDPDSVGVKHNFDREIKNLDFYDATLANFTGRVVGGDIEGDKDLGFGLSQNNIGVAELVLTPLNDTYRMNVVKQEEETTFSYETNPDTVFVASATNHINSKSWRGAGANDCKNIFIHTDSLTGEFSAMLPPLEYKLDDIKVVKTGFIMVGSSTTIDLTNVQMERSDSLRQDDSIEETYSYNAKLMQTYHSTPVFNVTQENHDDGAFGLSSYTLKDEEGEITIDDIYTIENGQPVYKYGGAIFDMYENYTFNIEAHEEYINSDSGTPITSYVPLQNLVVTIDNALSSDQAVAGEEVTVDGESYSPGEVVALKSNQLRLDSIGCATYRWMAGLPNIAAPYSRNISITYQIGDRTYVWNDGGLTGIVLGDLPTGNNFVTAGPDMLQMILRDPPGSRSKTEWTKGSCVSEIYNYAGNLSIDGHLNGSIRFGLDTNQATGATGVYLVTGTTYRDNIDLGLSGHVGFHGDRTFNTTIENTKTISTSDDPEFVGAAGDVFIGTATNIIFGACNNVGFHRVGSSNEVQLNVEESISSGMSFSTDFSYTQSYIENTLMPNLELLRNSMLKTVSQETIDTYVNNGRYPVYLTTRAPGDPGYGESNKDEKGNTTSSGDSYTMFVPQGSDESFQDSVLWYNEQIKAWTTYLKYNEAEKVRAYENRENPDSVKYKNYSFDSGTSVTKTYERLNYNNAMHFTADAQIGFTFDLTTGVTFGTKETSGCMINLGFNIIPGFEFNYDYTKSNTTDYNFILAEDGDDNALTVDVYDYGGYAPIFRTRGGQTSAPYEKEVVTKYYNPGTTIMEGTMQIEVPQIQAEKSTVTDIPSGSTATYTLKLSNASETNEELYYRLMQAEETNPYGAMLFVDGMPLTDSRIIKIPAHEAVYKTLLLKQSDQSILNYERIGIVLASQSQYQPSTNWDVIADTVFISAYYVPSSSPVTLALSKNVINTNTSTDVVLTMTDFDRTYRGQKAFRMEYKKQGETTWTQIHEYVLNEADMKNNSELLSKEGSSVSYTQSMKSFPDGEYLFRIVSASTYGNEEVRTTSEELALVKDMQKPTPIGVPEPADGILDIGDELSVTFNEAILKGELTNEANIRVTGVLNGAEIAHETALNLTASEAATASTEANIDLKDKDFAFDMWVNLTGEGGTLLTHGSGTEKLTLGINDASQFVVTIGNSTYTSTDAVPTGKWAFLSLSLTVDGKLNASVADDANTTNLFLEKAVDAYTGKGLLTVGGGTTAALHELLLWDEAHDMTTALLNRSKTKNPSTRHLIGYWKMDEGEGTTIRDYARNRHMTMADETWYLNNENKAISLDGNSYVSIDASELPTSVNDDYALEFWMRGNVQTGEAQLLQMGDVALSLNAEGTLQLANTSNGNTKTFVTTASGLTDNVWHHVALNVLRQGTAAAYVDGKRCFSTNAANVGSITTNNLILGARRTSTYNEAGVVEGYTYDRAFTGQMDEVRVWNATLNGDFLTKNRKVRLTGSEDGLVAYYPFEKKELDEGNQVSTVGDAADLTGSGLKAQLCALDGSSTEAAYTNEAPALRTKPSETNVSFSFVASEEKVVITLNEDASTIEGCTLNFTVKDVCDENGNYSDPAVWSAFVNQKELEWQESALDCVANVTEGATFTAEIINKSGNQQMWTLSGMPSWLSVSEEYGTTNPLKTSTVTFTVSPATPIGKYEETIYLSGNNGIETPLVVRVKVVGQEPDWSVNAADYEFSMNVIGRVEAEGVPMDDGDDVVAAFIGEECRGVAHPTYVERYDSYFVTMNIYGDGGDADKKVTFRAYDASSGTLYPEVEADRGIVFKSLALEGRYDNPVLLTALNEIEQSTDLEQGWNWLSLYVKTDDKQASEVLEKVADDVLVIKSQSRGWLMYEDSVWSGNLTTLHNEEMYAVQMRNARTLRVVGQPVVAAECPIALKSGWNWMGYYGRKVTSVADGLAGMSPADGDVLKGQDGIAYFDKYEWSGPLTMMEPGVGYMVFTPTDRTFSYSQKVLEARVLSDRCSVLGDESGQPTTVFTPVDYHNYPYNAIMTARVMSGGNPVGDIELGVFVDNECRAAEVIGERAIAFLTIPGEDSGTICFKVAVGGKTYLAKESFDYEADAIYGSPKNPVIINLDDAMEIDGIDAVRLTNSNGAWYDLAGRKVNAQREDVNRQLQKGIYIINGEKKVVR